jgi:hypothetical protein
MNPTLERSEADPLSPEEEPLAQDLERNQVVVSLTEFPRPLMCRQSQLVIGIETCH